MTLGAFWRSQQRRRAAVICLYLGYLVGFLSCALTTRGSIPQGLGVLLMGVSALTAGFGLLGVLQARQVLFLGSVGMMDERQQAVRDRAYYSAYRGLSLVVLGGILYLARGQFRRSQPVELARSEVLLLAGGLLLLIVTLPSAIMAWTEQDPPEDSGAHGMIDRRSL